MYYHRITQYVSVFEENEVDGPILLELDKAELKKEVLALTLSLASLSFPRSLALALALSWLSLGVRESSTMEIMR